MTMRLSQQGRKTFSEFKVRVVPILHGNVRKNKTVWEAGLYLATGNGLLLSDCLSVCLRGAANNKLRSSL